MSIKKGSAPLRYDEEFKKGAVALVTEKGLSLKMPPRISVSVPIHCVHGWHPQVTSLRIWLNSTEPTVVRRSWKPKTKDYASCWLRKMRSSKS